MTMELWDPLKMEPLEDFFKPFTIPAFTRSGREDSESEKKDGVQIPEEVPILPLRGLVVYPMTVVPIRVGQPRSIRLIDDAVVGKRLIGLVASKNPELPEPGPDDVYQVGTLAIVHRLFKAPDDTITLLMQGLRRIRIEQFVATEPYLVARIREIPEQIEEGIEVEALQRSIVDTFRRLAELLPAVPEELIMMAINAENPLQLAYAIATHIRINLEDAQRLLELDSTREKLHFLLALLTKELEVVELGRKIQSEAQSEVEKAQREYFLREQLKAIQRELGEVSEQQMEVEEFRRKIEEAGMPEEAKKEALRELDRLSKLPTAAAEYSVIRTYLDWLVNLPWNVETEDNLDIAHARKVLDEDHYDLDEIKERILEYLAVRKLKEERKKAGLEEEEPTDQIRKEREGVILCFVGPPGTGKTSLGQSIARALGRKFVRQSLGGMRDEAEIRGHRRTYIGALPGRIIQALRRVGTKNPVFMLDEVDKIGMDFRGDPAAALLEVLDPEQNREFRDHYLDVPFDLSKVMFIATANLLDPIPAPLRDRMEILELSGYTEMEKVRIAQGYLIPRQRRENGLQEHEITFTDSALLRIIREYTREAGVRNLERQIGRICRKVATAIAEGKGKTPVRITARSIPKYLGRPRYFSESALRTEIPGVATGLGWTPTGGDVMFFEATKMPGKKGFQITGQLGDVMKESAYAALSYVRSKAKELGIPEDFFENTDIHLHVPAGAIPKDGPSAGVTIATALVSLLTGRKVRPDVGMTGEITLRGQVLPVGGIKEKVLAAHRAGLKVVILPKQNEQDLEEVPAEVRRALKFVLVNRVDEVFEAALEPDHRQSEQAQEEADGKDGKPRRRSGRRKKTSGQEGGA
ncbi:MAG: endopeptidase La [Anaerolineae bacterium]|nr:endopeptidase La [Anaerolineae bacterium]MCX8066519.1 endopeptidase La [Anaerolineae bacterium]MDW7990641.1 endopeptidase La [Anaerolineae bacterium]